MDESSRGLLLAKMMEEKLGILLTWEVPKIFQDVGPYDPSPFTDFEIRRRELVERCRERLSSYSDDQLKQLASRQAGDRENVFKEWRDHLSDEISRLKKRRPPWYAGGFGHPDYRADFAYWSQCSIYSLHEALLLSLGVEPDKFPERQVQDMVEKSLGEREDYWETLKFMLRRRRQLLKHFRAIRYHSGIPPSDLFNWIKLVELEIPAQFTSHYLRSPERGTETNGLPGNPDKREIDKICQLFAAMAIDQLGYNPKGQRSPIPKEITELAASMGLTVTDDTVRKYLRRGASFIPEDWEPPTN